MRTLKEDKGIEFYTDADGKLKAKTITDKIKSSRSKNKLSDLQVVDGVRNLAPREKETAVAVNKILKSKGKLSDISQEFNTDPKPDLTFKANGDVIVTPDNGKASYKIPVEDVDSVITENMDFRRKMKKLRESEAVSGMKWFRDGDVYKPNFFSSRRGPGVDAKAVDEELDSIIQKYDNCFPVKNDLTFEIEYWDTFNGDNVSVTFVFSRDFEGEEFGEVEELLNSKLLREFGFEDSDIAGTGWNRERDVREWSFNWYKYSDYNKDHTFKRPNSLDSNTKGNQINGTEPFNLEEGREISKAVMEYIVNLFKANPKKVYPGASSAIETVEIPEYRLRPFTTSWKGSYTHNTGWFGFSCYIEDVYDENATNWKGEKGKYYRADEDAITTLLKDKAAETLNDFLYEFNLEVVPEDCEAHWYHGSEEDEENGVLFEISIKFKEIGVDPVKSYYSHEGNSFKGYYDWDEENTRNLYKDRTFKRNPKRVKEAVKKKTIKDWIDSEMTDEVKEDVYEFLNSSDRYYLDDIVTENQFENIMFKNGFDDQGWMWKPLMQESKSDTAFLKKAAKIAKVEIACIEYFKNKDDWMVVLDSEDSYDADRFRNVVDGLLDANSGEYSYDDIEGLGDVHLGTAEYSEVSEDDYSDLDPDWRDKVVVYCEPSKRYKARRAIGW